jgi:hypothetical protein
MFNLISAIMKRLFLLMIAIVFIASSASAQTPIKYQGEVDLGYSVGVGAFGEERVNVHLLNGVKVGEYFSTGVGLGLDYYHSLDNNGELFIPIYLNLKGYLPVSDIVNPYVSCDVGVGIGATRDVSSLSGLYLTPAIGLHIKKWDTLFQIGYNMQRVSYEGVGVDVGALQFKFGLFF